MRCDNDLIYGRICRQRHMSVNPPVDVLLLTPNARVPSVIWFSLGKYLLLSSLCGSPCCLEVVGMARRYWAMEYGPTVLDPSSNATDNTIDAVCCFGRRMHVLGPSPATRAAHRQGSGDWEQVLDRPRVSLTLDAELSDASTPCFPSFDSVVYHIRAFVSGSTVHLPTVVLTHHN